MGTAKKIDRTVFGHQDKPDDVIALIVRVTQQEKELAETREIVQKCKLLLKENQALINQNKELLGLISRVNRELATGSLTVGSRYEINRIVNGGKYRA